MAIIVIGLIALIFIAAVQAAGRGWEGLMQAIEDADRTRMTVLGGKVRLIDVGRPKRKKKKAKAKPHKNVRAKKTIRVEGEMRPEMKTAIALHMLENGMDTTSNAAVHVATEQVMEIFHDMDDESQLVIEREHIVVEDDETSFHASMIASDEEFFEIDRRDETIRIED